MKALEFLICLLAIPIWSRAQKNDFQSFAALFNGKPGIIEVDKTLKKDDPIQTLPFMFSTAVKIFDCDKNGLPLSNEIEFNNKFCDSVESMLKKTMKYRYAGRRACDCVYLNYYFVEDTTGLRDKLTVLYKEQFSDRTLGLNFKEDRKWGTYFEYLLPNKKYNKLKEPVLIKP